MNRFRLSQPDDNRKDAVVVLQEYDRLVMTVHAYAQHFELNHGKSPFAPSYTAQNVVVDHAKALDEKKTRKNNTRAGSVREPARGTLLVRIESG